MKGSFKTALIAAVVSAFVAAGAAVATTQAFTLGTTNTVNAASTVTAGAAGLNAKMLQLTNNSTGSSATALGLTTPSSRPPMIVSSGARVANLNADRLDGIDSAGFVRGRGTFLANRLVSVPTIHKTLLTIPGLGYLDALCSPTDAWVTWVNNTSGNVDAWYDRFDSHFWGSIAAPGDIRTVVQRTTPAPGGTIALGVGNDPGPRRTALLHVFVFQSANGAPCGFQAQGTLWTSQ
jgi:hypothetical protein